jgi:hypothetical protein
LAYKLGAAHRDVEEAILCLYEAQKAKIIKNIEELKTNIRNKAASVAAGPFPPPEPVLTFEVQMPTLPLPSNSPPVAPKTRGRPKKATIGQRGFNG